MHQIKSKSLGEILADEAMFYGFKVSELNLKLPHVLKGELVVSGRNQHLAGAVVTDLGEASLPSVLCFSTPKSGASKK